MSIVWSRKRRFPASTTTSQETSVRGWRRRSACFVVIMTRVRATCVPRPDPRHFNELKPCHYRGGPSGRCRDADSVRRLPKRVESGAMSAATAEVVICGAGMAGVAAAYHLTVRRGIEDVVLVDE